MSAMVKSLRVVAARGAGMLLLAVPAVLAVLATVWPPAAMAQTEVYKCGDGKSITYSSTPCEKLGLTSAGAVRDRMTVINNSPPAAKQDASKGQEAAKPQATTADTDEQRARKAASVIKPVNPLIDRLLK